MSTNDALIRGTLESHRAELQKAVKTRQAASNKPEDTGASGGNSDTCVTGCAPPLPAGEMDQHPLQSHPHYETISSVE
jgi:hypothetical protein